MHPSSNFEELGSNISKINTFLAIFETFELNQVTS